MATMYEGIIVILEKFGFFNIFLPWMLTYALIYGLLLKSKIFGDPFDQNKPAEAKTIRTISSIIAFSIATILIGSTAVVLRIREVIPLAVLFIIIMFTLIMVLASIYLPKEKIEIGDKYIKLIALLAIIIFSLLIINIFGLLSGVSNVNLLNQYGDIIAALGYLFVFVFIVWLLVRSPSGSSTSGNQGSK